MAIILNNHDGNIHVSAVNMTNNIDHIPPAVYNIDVTQNGIVLQKDRARYDLPTKVYGNLESYRSQILETVNENETSSTGVILCGLKGSGKTLTAEMLANSFLIKDYPVFIIDRKLPASLLKAVAALGPCMMYFDEFGKNYRNLEGQSDTDGLLTLFSDSSLKKVLFVVTANSTTEISEFMLNRPGRFYYNIRFSDISAEVVEQMLSDFKVPEALHHLLRAYTLNGNVTMDIFRLVVREAAKCGETYKLMDRIAILNVPEFVTATLKVSCVTYKDKVMTKYTDVMISRIQNASINIASEEESLYSRKFRLSDFIDIHELEPDKEFTLDLLDGCTIVFKVDYTTKSYGSHKNYSALESDKSKQEYEESRKRAAEELANVNKNGGVVGYPSRSYLHNFVAATVVDAEPK